MKRSVATVAALVCATWMATLSVAPPLAAEGPDAQLQKGTKRTCFRVRETRGFHGLHDRYAYVKSARKQYYLLTIDQGCRGLNFTTWIAIANGFDRVCSNSGAMVAFREFGRLKTCRILEVEAVSGLQQAQDLVKDRTKAGVQPAKE
jgi:hypothetical protein